MSDPNTKQEKFSVTRKQNKINLKNFIGFNFKKKGQYFIA
jgi:hypothetical protein